MVMGGERGDLILNEKRFLDEIYLLDINHSFI